MCLHDMSGVWGSSPRKFWKTYSKTTYSEAFGLTKGGWKGQGGGGGGHLIFSSDLHWSQEWSRWAPKSLKAWKAWKRLTPVSRRWKLIVDKKLLDLALTWADCRLSKPARRYLVLLTFLDLWRPQLVRPQVGFLTHRKVQHLWSPLLQTLWETSCILHQGIS